MLSSGGLTLRLPCESNLVETWRLRCVKTFSVQNLYLAAYEDSRFYQSFKAAR